MAVKTEKELNEAQRALWLKALAAMELQNFGYAISLLQGILKQAPEFLTGRHLLRRTEVTKEKAGKKKLLQYLDVNDRGDESPTRNEESAAARGGDDRKSFGRRPFPPPSQSRFEGSGRCFWLAGDRRVRTANVARRKSARRKIAARARSASSSDGGKRTGSRSL